MLTDIIFCKKTVLPLEAWNIHYKECYSVLAETTV